MALVAVLLLSCSGSSAPVSGLPLVDENGCYYSCNMPCRGDGVCVPWPFVPSCLAPCNSDDDCANALCMMLTTDGLPPSTGGVCVGSGMLKICGPDRACTMLTPMCRNSTTLMKPLTMQKNLCGYELVNCPGGCDATTNKCN